MSLVAVDHARLEIIKASATTRVMEHNKQLEVTFRQEMRRLSSIQVDRPAIPLAKQTLQLEPLTFKPQPKPSVLRGVDEAVPRKETLEALSPLRAEAALKLVHLKPFDPANAPTNRLNSIKVDIISRFCFHCHQ